jgi:L-alanine-DL-glutamate epimerase-like enolase superfamily enzyme
MVTDDLGRIDRRRFLHCCGALPLGAGLLPELVLGAPDCDPSSRDPSDRDPSNRGARIERIEITPVRYPMTGYFKFFTGPHGSRGRAAVLVKIVADDGTHGWGQSVPIARWSYETLETVTVVLREYFAPSLLGHDPFDLEGAHARMDRVVAPGFSTGMPIARAGIDIALHDLAGKLTGRSLSQMWGRERGGALDLSWTLNPRSLDEVDDLIDAGRRRGYKHFNIKVAPDPEFDVALARRVREQATEAFLWADANGGYDPATALEVAPKLARAGVDVLEAPIPPNRIRGYRALKRQGALPILMDEGVVSPVELEEFIALDMIDGVAMKPSRCGGLVSARRQIELIEEAGLMWLGSGLTDPDVSLAATLALYGAHDLRRPAALNGPQFLDLDLLVEPAVVTDGRIAIPEGPGHGVEVDEEKLEVLRSACGTERTIHSR